MRFQNLLLKEDGEKRKHEENQEKRENRVEKDADEKQEKGNILLSLLIVYVL